MAGKQVDRVQFVCSTQFGEIWTGLYGGEHVIVKDTFLDNIKRKERVTSENSLEEELVYRKLAEEHIFVELKHVEITRPPFIPMHTMVFQPGVGDLFDVMAQKRKEGSLFSHTRRLNWCLQVVKLVDKMHDVGFAHLDLSLENILVLPDKTLRLLDAAAGGFFDSNVILNRDANPAWERWNHKLIGKTCYMFPAMARRQPYNPFVADVYSTAVVVYYILTHMSCELYKNVADHHFKAMEQRGLESFVKARMELFPGAVRGKGILVPMLPLLEELMTSRPKNWAQRLSEQLESLLASQKAS